MKVYVITEEDFDDGEMRSCISVYKVVSSEKKAIDRVAKLQKKNPGLHYDWEPFEVE